MRRIVASNRVVYYRSDLLWELGVRHAFTTRIGGVSSGPFASLNLGNPSAVALDSARRRPDAPAISSTSASPSHPPSDPAENIAANHRLVHEATGLPVPRYWVHQVHGAEVAHVFRGGAFVSGAKADTIVCDEPDATVTVRAADCAAVLVASVDGRHVAVAHAGWRGVVGGTLEAAVAALRVRATRNIPLAAAVFPCIGYRHFEVGEEVVRAFSEKDLPARLTPDEKGPGKGLADVPGACAELLRRSGVREIELSDRCTYEHADEFFSHRRDRGVTGRMALFAAPRAAGAQ